MSELTLLSRIFSPKFPVTVTFETVLPIKSRYTNTALACVEAGVISKDFNKVVALMVAIHKDQRLWYAIPMYPDTELGRSILAIKPDFMDLESLKDKVRSTIIKVNSTKE